MYRITITSTEADKQFRESNHESEKDPATHIPAVVSDKSATKAVSISLTAAIEVKSHKWMLVLGGLIRIKLGIEGGFTENTLGRVRCYLSYSRSGFGC